MSEPVNLLDLTPAAAQQVLSAWMASQGEPAYRARQLAARLWQRPVADWGDATEVPRRLVPALTAAFPLLRPTLATRQLSQDGTVKFLWRLPDGAAVESVLIPEGRRRTLCISSQAGCAFGCVFCATGRMGFQRHLAAWEIAAQVRELALDTTLGLPTNVVFMGMGEPLANVDAVCAALDRLHADLGISARHLTVSTVGVVPGMRRLARFPLPVTLAASLHAPDDELRATLVPLNHRYPIAAVIDAAREYAAIKGRRVTFEYACIADVNDRPDQAERLAHRLGGFRGGAHVNLIPLNPTGAFPGRPPDRERINRFAARLASAGVTVTVRRNRGVDIDAACGQLRSRPGPPNGPGPDRRAASARMVP
jgi:23S rRNA (adenine2503-C2)-methyltransferase